MLQTISIHVTGKVQGVWFRKHAQQQAMEAGVVGTVQNLPDGSVFIIATGEEDQLKSFSQWCREGPLLARVDNIEVQPLPIQVFPSFEICR